MKFKATIKQPLKRRRLQICVPAPALPKLPELMCHHLFNDFVPVEVQNAFLLPGEPGQTAGKFAAYKVGLCYSHVGKANLKCNFWGRLHRRGYGAGWH